MYSSTRIQVYSIHSEDVIASGLYLEPVAWICFLVGWLMQSKGSGQAGRTEPKPALVKFEEHSEDSIALQ